MDSHVPVLARRVLELLDPAPGDVVVDCTVGAGGHAAQLAARATPGGVLVGFDLDPASIEHSRLAIDVPGTRIELFRESFAAAPARLASLGLRASVVLADLGVSSTQLDDAVRGFSFRRDGPLDMRLDPTGPVTAAELVRTLSEADLAEIIFTLGEEPLARKIARKLAQTREREPIETTARLARLVLEAYGPRGRSSRMHPATRTFMALRIAVNEELDALRSLLAAIDRGTGPAGGMDGRGDIQGEGRREGRGEVRREVRHEEWLEAGARIAIISFHSLEDRLVKRAFAALARDGRVTRLTTKPVVASDAEIAENPRSRSAKLRAIRLGGAEAHAKDGPPHS